jgi:lipopolysaccharide transport protein LptA
VSGALVTLLWALSAVTKPTSAAADAVSVQVDAHQIQYRSKQRQIVFLGKPLVRLKRQDATLMCHRLVANNDDKGQIATADCTGDVRLERGEQIVTCATATFDNAAGEVVCRGNPVIIRDGQSVMRGDKLTYDLDSGNAVLTGRPASGQVVPKPGEQTVRRKKKAEGGQ